MRGLLIALLLLAAVPATAQVAPQPGPGPCPFEASSCTATPTGTTTSRTLANVAMRAAIVASPPSGGDDYASLAASLAALCSSNVGGDLLLQPGTYHISASLVSPTCGSA